VLCGSQAIRDQFSGDPWIHFCNGYFEVYLLVKGTHSVKNNCGTTLIGDMFISCDC
jgi:hypothetical protein